jgi:tRNA threonylcarbamoyl adenosine modification protein YjeE
MSTSAELLLAGPAATRAVGEAVGRALEPGDLIGMVGELGSGKTALAGAIAAGAGWAGRVPSPTFQLVRVHRGRVTIHHADLHRISGPAEAAGLGLLDALPGGAVLIEWADRWPQLREFSALWVELESLGGDRRLLRATGVPRLIAPLADAA